MKRHKFFRVQIFDTDYNYTECGLQLPKKHTWKYWFFVNCKNCKRTR